MMTSLQQQKKAEADGHMKRAKKLMEKTMFQWKPDYLGAAPLLEKAAEAYRSAGDLDQAKRVFAQAAVVQTKNKSSFRAAQNCENAAKIIIQQIRAARADSSEKKALLKELQASYEGACTHFSDMGELGKAAEALIKGATACEEAGMTETKELYLRACSLMEAQGKPHFAVDTFRKTFTFLVKKELYQESLALIKRQIAIYAEIDQVSNIHKCQLSEIVLLLTLGDVAAADRAYMDHLQSDAFLKSDECALVEDLVRAYKTGNEELLQQTIRKQGFGFLDNQVGRLARKLSIYGNGNLPTSGGLPPPKNPYESSGPPPAPVSIPPEEPLEFETADESTAVEADQGTNDFNFDALEFASESAAVTEDSSAPPIDNEVPSHQQEMTEEFLDLT